jgi:hypothetical protein
MDRRQATGLNAIKQAKTSETLQNGGVAKWRPSGKYSFVNLCLYVAINK